MPGSPKIWGTLELEKQGDSCRGTSRPQPTPALTPGRGEAMGSPEGHPVEPREQPPEGNQPSIHHIKSDSTTTPVQLRCNR